MKIFIINFEKVKNMAYVPSSLTLYIIHDSTDKIKCSGSNNNLRQFPCIHMIGLRKISGKKSYGGIIKKESHFSAEKKKYAYQLQYK